MLVKNTAVVKINFQLHITKAVGYCLTCNKFNAVAKVLSLLFATS